MNKVKPVYREQSRESVWNK